MARAAEETPRGRVKLLGVSFDNLSRREAAQAIAGLVLADGQSYVVKPYSEFMPRAARDSSLREVLNGAALCLPDGVGILWATHYLSLRGGTLRALLQLPFSLASLALNLGAIRNVLKEQMAGVDLTWEMLSRLDEAGRSVYLLGGREHELQGARRRIEERLPGLRLAGARHGHFDTEGAENEEVVAEINAVAPNVLLVAMGFPLQEQWIAANVPRLTVNVAVAEGGSFSFISGATRRAPLWMRRAGLEWLFRLLRQPSRLRRQLAIPAFIWLVLRERLRGRS
jgi:N-acetylglucosaminyldiphosphoundecaprenol N-acetyl-beta-D-mannosaminyltransferase